MKFFESIQFLKFFFQKKHFLLTHVFNNTKILLKMLYKTRITFQKRMMFSIEKKTFFQKTQNKNITTLDLKIKEKDLYLHHLIQNTIQKIFIYSNNNIFQNIYLN